MEGRTAWGGYDMLNQNTESETHGRPELVPSPATRDREVCAHGSGVCMGVRAPVLSVDMVSFVGGTRESCVVCLRDVRPSVRHRVQCLRPASCV
mgnify:CR=1 FL=1